MKLTHTIIYTVVRMTVKDFLASDHLVFMEYHDHQPSYRYGAFNAAYLESLNPRRKLYVVLSEDHRPVGIDP